MGSLSPFLLLLLVAIPGALSYNFDNFILGNSSLGYDEPEKSIPDSWAFMERILNETAAILATRDADVIEKMLFKKFIFMGCKANYIKSTIVKKIVAVPASVELKFKIISCIWIPNTGHLELMLVTPKELFTRVDAQFHYCPHKQLWWDANFPFCRNPENPQEDVPSQEYFVEELDEPAVIGQSMMPIPDDSNEVVQKFLGTMEQAIATKDSEEIGKLFGENFVFKGCRGTYTKADAIQKLVSFPRDTPPSFTLVSSKWVIHGQIEYTVDVSLPIIDDIRAEFIYCPYKKVLKSGNIPKCAAQRKFY